MNVKTTTSVGEIAVLKGYITRDQMDEAMLMHTVASRRKPHVTLGSVLLELGYLTPEQLRDAEQQQKDFLEEQVQQEIPEGVQEALKVPSNRYGKFVRMELLGRGGLGEVWKAYDLILRRTVAIKFVQSIRDDHWKLFLREAEVLGKLQHPHIVPLFEIGDRFIVMPYLTGKTLDVSELSIAGAARVVQQAALAIQYAHERGILHRDIKPTNIMIDPVHAGQVHVWVMDFGIAKEVHSKETLQTTGMILGTPAYMAPELVRGRSAHADVRSDVYSLGATLYQAVTRRMPFLDEDLYELMRSIVEEELDIPQDIPRDLRAIIRKAMEKSPESRYAAAGELAADLGRYLEGDPVLARPSGWMRRAGRRLARSRVLVGFMLLGLAGVAFGIFGLTRDRGGAEKNAGLNSSANKWTPQEQNREPQAQQGYSEQRSVQKDKQSGKSPQAPKQPPLPEENKHSESDRLIQSSKMHYNVFDQEGALTKANEAIRMDPVNPAAYLQRARVYVKLGQYAEAKKDVEECLRVNPKYSEEANPILLDIIKGQESQQKEQEPSPKGKIKK